MTRSNPHRDPLYWQDQASARHNRMRLQLAFATGILLGLVIGAASVMFAMAMAVKMGL